jgi:hypothetical protein
MRRPGPYPVGTQGPRPPCPPLRHTKTPHHPPNPLPPISSHAPLDVSLNTSWANRSPGEAQLDALLHHVDGIPPVFEYHPFRHIDFKEQAYIRKQPARKSAERLPDCGSEFFMDFGFMRASTDNYKRPNKTTNRVVQSYDGYSAYLLIVDGASRRVWVFLTKSKNPPIEILRAFLTKFGLSKGVIRTDQGGELARSDAFRTTMMEEFGYTVEPAGAGSPSQNGGAEIYNGTLAVKVRTLLYGSGLLAKFWSAALLHSVYLHNRLVHSSVGMTPYEAWYGRRPDVTFLKPLAPKFVSDNQALGGANSTVTISQESSWGIPPQIRTLFTSTPPLVSSKRATMQYSMRHGTFSLPDPLRLSCYMISALRQRTSQSTFTALYS